MSAGDSHDGGVRRAGAIFLLAGVGIYGCALLGYAFRIYPTQVAALWPGAGFMLALLVLVDRRHWAVALVGAVVGNAVADLGHGAPILIALGGGATNGVESLVAAWLLVKLLGPRLTLTNLREVSALVLGAAVLSNAFTSLLGGLFLHVAWHESFWRGWFMWWAGDGLGMLVIAPLVLTWSHVVRSRERIPPALALEAGLVLLATAIVARAVLSSQPTSGSALASYPYMVFPLLIWSGVRFGSWGAATATAVLACFTAWDGARAPGLFAQAGPMSQLLQIYGYLGLASFSSLVPAAALHERQDAELRLRESEARFRQMAETINEMFYVVDLVTGAPLYVSPAWTQIWARPMEQAYDSRLWLRSIHPDDRADIVATQEAVQRGESTQTDFRVVHPDGTVRWVRGRSFPVRDRSGVVYRAVGLLQDITRVREAEEHAIQAQRMEAVGQLAGGIAHDFNNLLTVILSSSELARTGISETSPAYEDLLAVQQASESASRLTRQLLAFSRQQVLQPRVFRLNDVISRTSGMLQRLIGEDIQLTTTLDADAGSVRADVGSLEQVLVNLSVNARDAMPDGGALLIELRNVTLREPADGESVPPGDYVMLAVSDTGVGMDATTAAHVFEPFFTTKARGKGTGLGLATVYGIVRQSGGHISVDSGPGEGTSFRLYFPRVRRSETTAEPARSADLPPGGGECVLVVEDEAAVRTIMRRTLEKGGYQVLEAEDGVDALEVLAGHDGPVHLLITDVVMPRMDGPTLAGRFAALRPDARILFVSGYTDNAVLRDGVLHSSVEYLGKPFSTHELTLKVRRVLDGTQRRAPDGTQRRAPDEARRRVGDGAWRRVGDGAWRRVPDGAWRRVSGRAWCGAPDRRPGSRGRHRPVPAGRGRPHGAAGKRGPEPRVAQTGRHNGGTDLHTLRPHG